MASTAESETRPTAAVEWARWTGWAGSLELMAHVARAAERAICESRMASLQEPLPDLPVHFVGTFSVEGDVEIFETPDAILHDITPEALAGREAADLVLWTDQVEVRISFLFAPESDAKVELTVTGTQAQRDYVAAVAGSTALALRRGYRRHLARVEFSDGLAADQVGRRSPFGPFATWLAPALLGIATGLTFVLFLDVFFPKAEIPSQVNSAIAIGLGSAYPLWIAFAIPRVEIAAGGKTRLKRTLSKLIVGLAALILTTAAKALLGGD